MPRISFLSALLALVIGEVACAYVEAPMTLGSVIAQSTNVCVVQVTKVDKAQNLIIYQKVMDIKGKHNQEVIKHSIKQELKQGEIKEIMNWAEPGKMAVFFHNGAASETCTGMNWYQCYPQGDWWGMSHGEPFLLRSYAGKAEKLPSFVADIVAGKEAIVPCMVDGNKEDLHKRVARIQRVKASLKLQDYNPKRDFVGWGGEDIRKLAGMPGFSQFGALGRVDAEGQSITCVDFDGDGKIDICLSSTSRVVLLQNQGDSFSEVFLPGLVGGSRATVWADYNGDGKPDLFLATARGPKLYTNLGNNQFRDDSAILPVEPCYDLTGAAWIDADGDGKPDLLLANGFHGLRLYKNNFPPEALVKLVPPKLGPWHYIGPFDNAGQKGFATVYPPEEEIELTKKYAGRGGKVGWQNGNFADGSVNNLAIFAPQFNSDSVVYLYREIQAASPTELPVSFGSDDTLTVWCNGEKIISENVNRGAAPDQNKANLKLKAGKNTLLMKICQGNGDWAFYFSAGSPIVALGKWFDDVSAAWGLGAESPAGLVKGDSIAVADVNGDGKPDFLFGAGTGMLFINTGNRFELRPDCGLSYQPSKTGACVADFNGDGHPGLFIPQRGKCKLYRNDGGGRFIDVTDRAGDLAKPIPYAVSAAWGDFNNDGKPDLVVGCLRGPNRYFENNGNGSFTEKTSEIGLDQRIFNSQAVALADLNNDGKLDLILNNEGQDSAVLFGNAEHAKGKCTSVVVQPGLESVGSRLRMLDKAGNLVAMQDASGGEARGGQGCLSPRFTAPPGTYRLEVRTPSGKSATKEIVVGDSPMRVTMGAEETKMKK
jgi:FG-GAP-like repeat